MNITRYISKVVLAFSAFCSIAAVSIGTLTSCDDFLDVKSETVAKENELFETEEGFQDALTGCYELMAAQSAYGKNLTFYMTDALANYWNLGLSMSSTLEVMKNIENFNYTNEDAKTLIKSSYQQLFRTVLQSNIILKNLKTNGNAISDPALRAVIEGECHAIRAYCQFDILRLFGQIPQNATKQISLPYNESTTIYDIPPYYTFTEYVDKLKADLAKAEALLKANDPVYTTYSFNQTMHLGYNVPAFQEKYLYYRRMRLNYWAVRAMQARLALYCGEKQNAHDIAMDIINARNDNGKKVVELSGLYNLPMEGNATVYPCLPDENIFSLSKYDLLNYTDQYFPLTSLTDNTLTLSTAQFDQLYSGQTIASDNRYARWWRLCTSSQGIQGKVLTKYYWNSNPNTGTKANINDNLIIPMIRLSEIYLMAIETSTDLSKANSLYSEYMRSHNVLLTADAFTSLDQIPAAILAEYRREMIGEGAMFYVYKRLCSSTILWHSNAVSEKDYEIPLPDTEMSDDKQSDNTK